MTGIRNQRVLQELAKNTDGYFSDRGNFRNGLNEGYDGTGPGFRIRYSQLQNCFDGFDGFIKFGL